MKIKSTLLQIKITKYIFYFCLFRFISIVAFNRSGGFFYILGMLNIEYRKFYHNLVIFLLRSSKKLSLFLANDVPNEINFCV